MENQNIINGINGPVVTVKDARSFSMMEMVFVGNERLVGEVIGITDKFTTIQVYEETTGLTLGEPIYGTGSPMNVTLGPGIMSSIFDGIERPLKAIAEESGTYIAPREHRAFSGRREAVGCDHEGPGGRRAERRRRVCRGSRNPFRYATGACFPPKIGKAVVTKVYPNGKYKVNDTVLEVKDQNGKVHELSLCQRWPHPESAPGSPAHVFYHPADYRPAHPGYAVPHC